MQQTMTTQAPPKSPSHPQPGTATVADIMQRPLTTVGQHDHLAAAAYLMKHAGTTALLVADTRTGHPVGIITETDIAHAIADGKDINDARAGAVLTTRPALTTTTSISDAARIMTTRHYRHLPVADDTGLLGLVDVIDLCQALIGAEEG